MDLRNTVKEGLFKTSRYLGVNAVLRKRLSGNLLILCYHGVVADDHFEDPYRYRNTVSRREFRWQLETLCRLFNPISPWDLLDWIDGKATLPPSALLITFDDGFRNNLTLAAPELERQGLSALFHVTIDYIGKNDMLWTQELNEWVLRWPHAKLPMPGQQADLPISPDTTGRIKIADHVRSLCKQIPDEERRVYLDRLRNGTSTFNNHELNELYGFLNWDEVRMLHKRGFAIGSHSVNHPILSRLSRVALDHELNESKKTIERELEVPCPWIAYPNGGPNDFSSEVIERVAEAGYRAGFTLMGQFNDLRPDMFRLDRVRICGHVSDCVFHARLSGLYSSILKMGLS